MLLRKKKSDLVSFNLKGEVYSLIEKDFELIEHIDKTVQLKGFCLCKREQVFNEKGNLISSSNENIKNKTYEITRFDYTNKANIIKEDTYNRELALIKSEMFQYYLKFDEIEKIPFNYINSTKIKYSLVYDSFDNIIIEEWFDDNGNNDEKCTYEYNNIGQIIKKSKYCFSDTPNEIVEYKYSDDGNLIDKIIINPYDDLDKYSGYESYKYEHDKLGNIIKSSKENFYGYKNNPDDEFDGTSSYETIDYKYI